MEALLKNKKKHVILLLEENKTLRYLFEDSLINYFNNQELKIEAEILAAQNGEEAKTFFKNIPEIELIVMNIEIFEEIHEKFINEILKIKQLKILVLCLKRMCKNYVPCEFYSINPFYEDQFAQKVLGLIN